MPRGSSTDTYADGSYSGYISGDLYFRFWYNSSLDATDPIITANPGDITVGLGYTGQKLSWTATDPNPDTYTIDLLGSGQVVPPTAWTSGNPISSYNIPDGLSVGTYVYIVNFIDDYDNNKSHCITFTVQDTTDPGITDNPSDITVITIIIIFIVVMGSVGGIAGGTIYSKKSKAKKESVHKKDLSTQSKLEKVMQTEAPMKTATKEPKKDISQVERITKVVSKPEVRAPELPRAAPRPEVKEIPKVSFLESEIIKPLAQKITPKPKMKEYPKSISKPEVKEIPKIISKPEVRKPELLIVAPKPEVKEIPKIISKPIVSTQEIPRVASRPEMKEILKSPSQLVQKDEEKPL